MDNRKRAGKMIICLNLIVPPYLPDKRFLPEEETFP
jgi:hypothetical protein